MKLLIGSKNKDKIKEIKQILDAYGLNWEIYSLQDFPMLPDVEEDAPTLLGNAVKKAEIMASFSNMLTLADDTGLFVEALHGEPGVFTARYAGEHCSYEDNRQKLLVELSKKDERAAVFKTVVALADAKGFVAAALGKVDGQITKEELGNNGFGYDPIFIPEETGKTFAQMTDAEKNKLSHRSRALENMICFLQNYQKKEDTYGNKSADFSPI